MSAKIEREDGSVGQLFPDVYIPNTQGNGQFNLGKIVELPHLTQHHAAPA
ncbi:hypothetical protein [Streptomyces albofaciens]|nr:hypothetical protein [Streptomyces albofaciens]